MIEKGSQMKNSQTIYYLLIDYVMNATMLLAYFVYLIFFFFILIALFYILKYTTPKISSILHSLPISSAP